MFKHTATAPGDILIGAISIRVLLVVRFVPPPQPASATIASASSPHQRPSSLLLEVLRGRWPVPNRTPKGFLLTLPITETSLQQIGWDDGWEAAFERYRAAGLVPALALRFSTAVLTT